MPEESFIGFTLFATQTTVQTGIFLYQIPKYRFPEVPGLKKPNSKLPSLEIKVFPSGRGSDGEMESIAVEAFKKIRKQVPTIAIKVKISIACLKLKLSPGKINYEPP
ncbi:hypothetical protein SLEP1_g55820 [Rubroshorea leprosula]|uniref:Uncharacterized protein n=1 Tax=Rubroshorea leprosula TaxID=152421 RepID=A0AAV5MHQ9_9ROSI|nr:hypothetical protein SLEP1_g55820 [Rubroshorea leprosula]